MLSMLTKVNGTIFINGVLKGFEVFSLSNNDYIVIDVDNGGSHHNIPKQVIYNEDKRLFRVSGNKYKIDSINKVLI